MKHFIPTNFKVPDLFQNERLRIRMLTVNDVVKDYDAIMSSIQHLQKIKPFGPNQKWPMGLTLEQNLIDLGWHQKEFQMRSSFAYTVVNLDESQTLGSVYIDPSENNNFDVEIHMWVRTSEIHKGLDTYLFNSVKQWISSDWPFKNVAYPGREINWEKWGLMN